jgi:hypothetical protein
MGRLAGRHVPDRRVAPTALLAGARRAAAVGCLRAIAALGAIAGFGAITSVGAVAAFGTITGCAVTRADTILSSIEHFLAIANGKIG